MCSFETFGTSIFQKAVLSIQAKDNKCFIWSILAHLAINENKFNAKKQWLHLERTSVLRKFEKYINPTNITFPVDIKSIKKFELNNKHLNIRINVYSWESIGLFQSSVVPIYISKLKAENTIKLLLHDNHYWLIKNFNRLGGSFGSTYHRYCENCLCGFHTKQKLKNHRKYCQHFKPTATIMPSKTGSF